MTCHNFSPCTSTWITHSQESSCRDFPKSQTAAERHAQVPQVATYSSLDTKKCDGKKQVEFLFLLFFVIFVALSSMELDCFFSASRSTTSPPSWSFSTGGCNEHARGTQHMVLLDDAPLPILPQRAPLLLPRCPWPDSYSRQGAPVANSRSSTHSMHHSMA